MVTRGDHAFVAYARKYRAGTRHEIVVFRVEGADDVWRKVRRVPVDSAAQRRSLALPDGHVFQVRHDNGTGRRQWIRVYPPGEAPREILDDDDDSRSPGTWSDLLPGPRAL